MIWNLLNCQFRQIFRLEIEDTITGIEPFPGEMMSPKRMNVALLDDIYDILVEYYNNTYDSEFVTIAKAATERSGDRIVVRPQVNQFGRIRVGSEIFGSVNASRYLRSSFIRVKFVQEMIRLKYFWVRSDTTLNMKLIGGLSQLQTIK